MLDEIIKPKAGHSTGEAEASHPVIFLAGGSAISPILSALNAALIEQPKNKFLLCFSSETTEDATSSRPLLEEIRDRFDDRVDIQILCGQQNGLLAKQQLTQWLESHSRASSNTATYFLYGPTSSREFFRAALDSFGVEPGRIYENVVHSWDAKFQFAAHPRKTATILWDRSAYEIEFAPDETVLEACLREGIPIPHSCRAGKCGKCLGRCLAGKVGMRTDENFVPCIPEDSIKNGAVLACSSYPQSENACIAFDSITTSSLLPNDSIISAEQEKEGKFDLFSSLIYGWLTISLVFPLLIEFLVLPLFSLVLQVDNIAIRTCMGGGLVLIAFVLAPLVHYGEAYIFRLPARFDLLGKIPISASLKAPFLYFPAAIILWMCIEVAISFSSGVYNTPTITEMFIFMTVIQISNIFVMDLVFWLVHGPYGLHHPALFGYLHAKHHRQRVSTFSTGPDLAPVDMVAEVSIFLVVPIACGWVLGFNSLEFIFCSLINTLMTSTWAHSPYQISKIVPQASVTQYLLYIFPWLTSNPHQAHHAKVECNYSIWGLWDKVFGTYQPMTEEDEKTARAIHMAELKRPGTFSFVYPMNSLFPYIELALSLLFCVLLWFVATSLEFRPLMKIATSILPL